MKTPLTYLATPYTHSNAWVMQERLRLSFAVESGMVAAGARVYNPLRYSSAYDYEVDPQAPRPSEDYWREFGLQLLGACDLLFVLQLPGWEDSVGVRLELERAESLDIPRVCLSTHASFLDGYTPEDYAEHVRLNEGVWREHRKGARGETA